MSIPAKIGVFIVTILVALAVALIILIQTQVTPEKIRKTLLPLVEKRLERKVDFGEIEIGLFSGISIADLKVMKKDTAREFVSVKSLELHYQFWPLLTGKVVIDQILLDQPKIQVTRMPDGCFNFSDLLPESAAENNGTVSKSNNDVSSAVPAAFNLLVKEISIKAGELHYIDKFRNVRTPFRYTLDKLNIKASQITFDKSFPIDLSAVLNGSNVDISGNYDLSRRSGNLLIRLAPLELVRFAPYYRDMLPGKLGSALLAMNLEIDLQPDQVASKGKIELDQVDLVLNDFPDAVLKNVKVGADYALTYDFEKQLLEFSTLLLNFNGIKLGAEGVFDLSAPEPYLALVLLLDQFDLREVMQNIPSELTRKYQKYSFAGLVNGRINLSGKLNSGADLLKSAQLNLSGVQASAENLRAGISGDITYSNKVVQSENLVLKYGDQQAHLKIKAENLPDDLVRGQFVLTAKELNLNNMLPGPTETLKETGKTGNSLPRIERRKNLADEIGPFNVPVDMVGTLAIDHLLYKQLSMNKVVADLSLKNNQLSINNLSSQIGGGELKVSAIVDLGVKGLVYQGRMVLSQPDIMTLVSGLAPETKQRVSGQLQLQNSFYGRGILPDNLLQTLQVKGEFNLQQGTARGTPLLEQLAGFLGNPDLKILSFKSLTSRYDLRDGIVHLSGYLDSSKTKLTPHGTIGVDGRLNLNLDARLAPEIMNKLGIGESLKQAMKDQNGWGILPLRIQGTLSRPRIGFDSKALQKQALEKAKEKVSQKLLEKIMPGTEEDIEPIRQLLDNTLNKLFGN